MNTLKTVRRAGFVAALALALGLGVASTTPLVYANCGTQSGGPGCGKQALPSPQPPSDNPAPGDSFFERFIKVAGDLLADLF